MSEQSKLAKALRGLLDDTHLYTRKEWSLILGVTPGAISQWLKDKTIPRSITLRHIVDALEQKKDLCLASLDGFFSLLDQPATEVSPVHASKIGRTLGDYVIQHDLDAFLVRLSMALHSTAPSRKAEFLKRAKQALPSFSNPEQAAYNDLVEKYPSGAGVSDMDVFVIANCNGLWQQVYVISKSPKELLSNDVSQNNNQPVLNLYQAFVKYLIVCRGVQLTYVVSVEDKIEFQGKLDKAVRQMNLGCESAKISKDISPVSEVAIQPNKFKEIFSIVKVCTEDGDWVEPSVVVIFNPGQEYTFGYRWLQSNDKGRVLDRDLLERISKVVDENCNGNVIPIDVFSKKRA